MSGPAAHDRADPDVSSSAGQADAAGWPAESDAPWAMPLILHIPKGDPPARTPILQAAASAAVAVVADPRAAPGGPWEPRVTRWLDTQIRKVSRRARGAQWDATAEFAGITIRAAGAEVRALLPWPITALDRRISRLQVGGTELADPAPADPAPPAVVPLLIVNAALGMSTGKIAAQVAHGSMLLWPLLSAEDRAVWRESGFACTVEFADAGRWHRELAAAGQMATAVVVRDGGFTEIAPGSSTVIARWQRP